MKKLIIIQQSDFLKNIISVLDSDKFIAFLTGKY